MKRDDCSKQLAEAKIASQMPQERKKQKSQYIVDNSGSHSHTAEQACTPFLFTILLFSRGGAVIAEPFGTSLSILQMPECWSKSEIVAMHKEANERRSVLLHRWTG